MGKKVKKRINYFRIFMLSFLVIILLIGLGAGGYFYKYLSSFNKSSNKTNEDTVKPVAVKSDEMVNILLMGVDIGDAQSKDKNDPKRTDTIMLMNYNPKTDEINIASIPRDTMIEVKGKRRKINELHAVGGPSYLIDGVEKLLDIQVNYYAKVDYEGFRKIIDTIGGLDMKINTRMDYDDPVQNLHIHFKKGETVHLDGKKAEEFFRWRKNNDGTGLADGDLGRIENQHDFVNKVMEKFKSPSIITKIPSILSTVPNYTVTNMDANNILKYGYIFAKVDKAKISMSTLKGDTGYVDGLSYFMYDESLNKDLLAKLHNQNKTTTEIVLDKSKLKVQVLNGTARQGLASNFSSIIDKKGYSNIGTGNTKNAKESKITLNGLDEKYVPLIKKELGINNVDINPSKGQKFDIVVVLGEDYN